jgi:hypothetical protein
MVPLQAGAHARFWDCLIGKLFPQTANIFGVFANECAVFLKVCSICNLIAYQAGN